MRLATSFLVLSLAACAQNREQGRAMDAATRNAVIDGAAAKLEEFYVFPDTAKKMNEAIRERQRRGEYDSIERRDRPPSEEEQTRFRRDMARVNCGFDKAERLDENIGYLKFRFFGPVSACGETASAAMSFLAETDALIVDLRENGGGEPAMIAHISKPSMC